MKLTLLAALLTLTTLQAQAIPEGYFSEAQAISKASDLELQFPHSVGVLGFCFLIQGEVPLYLQTSYPTNPVTLKICKESVTLWQQ